VATNLGMHALLLERPELAAGGVDTSFLGRLFGREAAGHEAAAGRRHG
jgi:hypothetical protein